MPRSEIEVIVDHALLSDDNLSIALLIADAAEQLRSRVRNDFLRDLSASLSTLGPRWLIETNCKIGNSHTEMVVARLGLQFATLRLVLSSNDRPVTIKPYFGIRLDPKPNNDSALAIHEKLKRAVDQEFAHGENDSDCYWSWYWYIDNKYSPWTSREVILRLRTPEALIYFGESLKKIAQVLEKALVEHT